ncbi:MAG TPA: hypothetical protein VGG22_10400 [Candidatus Baltobacteraceae bacterium]|jgi:hypothetical protein
MSTEDQAAQALADLESKVEASVAAVRARAAEAKSKLERGVLNLQSHSETSAVAAEAADGAELNWDLEESSAEAPPLEEAPPPLDDFSLAAPEPPLSFKDELDVATDEDGIPLGD